MPTDYRFIWNNREVFINHKPNTFVGYNNVPFDHLVVQCDHALPLTAHQRAKGYYVDSEVLHSYGGPIEFIKEWLDEESEKPEWKAYEIMPRQLTLFF